MGKHISRRHILRFGTVMGLGALAGCDQITFPGLSGPAQNPAQPSGPSPLSDAPPADMSITSASGLRYEVQRTDADWRARLSEHEYAILREGGTEPRHSSPLATETRNGTYACKGCELPIYSSSEKIILPQGWVFFHHSYDNAVLTGVDQGHIEAHCRRCGSHLGHILYVETQVLHCINGTSLIFTPIGS